MKELLGETDEQLMVRIGSERYNKILLGEEAIRRLHEYVNSEIARIESEGAFVFIGVKQEGKGVSIAFMNSES